MSTELEQIVDRAKARIRKKTQDALENKIEEELTPERIRHWMLTTLEKERQMILDRLMGIDRTWSNPEFKKDGIFMETLRPMMAPILREIIEREFGDQLQAMLEEQVPKLKAQFKKSLTDTFQRTLHYEMEHLARLKGEKLAEKVIAEIRGELKL